MGIKEEFQVSKLGLEEDNAEDFYCCSVQRGNSPIPLLIIRFLVFIGCLSIVIASLVMTLPILSIDLWFAFLTHWGIIFITVTSFLAVVVSLRASYGKPIDSSMGLPWYVKAYWVWFNLTLPIAFFITLFYWALLATLDQEFAINKTLDVFIHAINSVLMLILLLASRHPSRVLHFYHAFLMGIFYLLFTIIYYFAGGLGPFGNGAIYPQLDWTKPGTAMLTVVGAAIGITVMHLFVVGIAALRDRLTKKYRNNSLPITTINDRFY